MCFRAKFISSNSPILAAPDVPAGNHRAFMTFQKISCRSLLHHLSPGEVRWTDRLPAGGDGNQCWPQTSARVAKEGKLIKKFDKRMPRDEGEGGRPGSGLPLRAGGGRRALSNAQPRPRMRCLRWGGRKVSHSYSWIPPLLCKRFLTSCKAFEKNPTLGGI